MSEFRAEVVAKETAPAPEAKNPDLVSDTEGTEVPIALYQELNQSPYTAKFFGIEKIWDGDGFKSDVEAIETAYRDKVANNILADGEDTYKSFIKEAEKATDSTNDPTSVKIAKIAEFIKFMHKMDKIDRNRSKYAAT